MPPSRQNRRSSSKAIRNASQPADKPAPAPAEPSGVSLLTLPTEILDQIIRTVAEYIPDERAELRWKRSFGGRVVTQEGQNHHYVTCWEDVTPVLNSLQSLGSVSRKLYELCRPSLWNRMPMLSFP